LHFANGIWDTNIGEVMGHAGTDPEIFERVVQFASEIGMIPIPQRAKWIYIEFFVGSILLQRKRIILVEF
jgi:3-hydroxyacyl-CoA dehydrogenase